MSGARVNDDAPMADAYTDLQGAIRAMRDAKTPAQGLAMQAVENAAGRLGHAHMRMMGDLWAALDSWAANPDPAKAGYALADRIGQVVREDAIEPLPTLKQAGGRDMSARRILARIMASDGWPVQETIEDMRAVACGYWNDERPRTVEIATAAIGPYNAAGWQGRLDLFGEPGNDEIADRFIASIGEGFDYEQGANIVRHCEGRLIELLCAAVAVSDHTAPGDDIAGAIARMAHRAAVSLRNELDAVPVDLASFEIATRAVAALYKVIHSELDTGLARPEFIRLWALAAGTLADACLDALIAIEDAIDELPGGVNYRLSHGREP